MYYIIFLCVKEDTFSVHSLQKYVGRLSSPLINPTVASSTFPNIHDLHCQLAILHVFIIPISLVLILGTRLLQCQCIPSMISIAWIEKDQDQGAMVHLLSVHWISVNLSTVWSGEC